ncbi:Proteinaceous RNase P 1, chloroplastic/mitochondrial [Arabidopsis thaliana]|jgi:proteinaceous RNase P|uniref:Proteinaceous RNase P 1, chloroplastic/mitochondrial n=4 Tax=Arabidopsis TaxID=3701 RepID=PRRP1_ARATH|nr:proteinaceous RNase P 1 [Arabidopsis thaliana]NP_850186.1 proteinaceous RNase P 1 [Arabidopsis thaliana]Q66GI4.1 RecName: Full=Proteinaceous RNase P 1, chloroplastic/mitochondrial; AltName: Full=Pentatricopeptide repeat-containing protein At2g32230; Flags: Precursor [Arabidopsis thaliana]KAG7638194.1 Pentatricopeptide repeat [Arabidopsis thaliana x Arabidopsis arenosa]KAG7642812.1 Pentatricopeptide repeat [Arabidopsis suecica]AAU05541.1 At2g32230 [Arabidopsis thaliana]AEC08652.1 proteinace|eukprot:NP_001324632.1 proteinaceous RNase P 1 [Arabidopsis thaliana]
MLRLTCFTPSFSRACCPLFAMMLKVPSVHLHHPRFSPFRFYHTSLLVKGTRDRRLILVERSRHLCTLPLAAAKQSAASPSENLSRKAKKKAIQQSPEALLKQKLDMCSKKGDVLEALRLYDEARRNGVQLSQYHYNVLLYVCSLAEAATESSPNPGLSRGFDIFKQMIVDKVVPNEATFTNGARLAVAKDDPEMAFDMVKQMKAFGIQPRLRSYGPALFGFCRKGDADKAYEVDAHMVESEVVPEEPELAALLKVSMDTKNADKVYKTLQRLRDLVRQVSKSTFDMIEEWFKSEVATKTGVKKWDVKKIRDAVVSGGGGWHGQGWLGTGKWNVKRTEMDENGVCKCCKEKLVCIDINPVETETFAASLTRLACEREVKANFNQFQEWLERHGPFDAVIDGANMGLVNQRSFSFFQLNNTVQRCQQISPSKRLPLVILHKSRVNGGPATYPKNRALLEKWKNAGALYATPPGSNDDWYWLYAAVSCKCLLVTNDEMRDHLFQLLGNSFFPRWKEKHQVRISVTREDGLKLNMPPPYSIVIQESEDGTWHVPMSVEDDLQTSRQWLCAKRSKTP